MKKNKPSRYTIMVVPDSAGENRSFSFKRATLVKWLAGLVVLLIIAAGGTYYYLPRALSYNTVQAKNEKLMKERFQVLRILDD